MVWSSVRRPLAVVGVLLLPLAAPAIAACGSQASDPPATVKTGAPGRVIPSGFVGLSTEL